MATWLMLLCSVALPCAAAPSPVTAPAADAAWILERLARTTPIRTPFVELRGSALLKAPLRVEGEYGRPDAATLVRDVRVPYAETTTIRAGQATIARPGKPPRTFALARAPELAGLQSGFGALLAGDRAALEAQYTVQARGTQPQWTLVLAPKDAAVARRVGSLVLHGRGAELRCIETHPVKGDVQRTLLAGAAREAAGVVDSAPLAALCDAGARP